eukprot:1176782-Prorocentrum_minimum.AAC.1
MGQVTTWLKLLTPPDTTSIGTGLDEGSPRFVPCPSSYIHQNQSTNRFTIIIMPSTGATNTLEHCCAATPGSRLQPGIKPMGTAHMTIHRT